MIDSAQGLTAQLAPRSHDIGALITGLDRTLRITSARTGSLSGGLERLPPTLDAARTTLARLTGTADAAKPPLAQRLGAVAQPLTTAVQTITPFVDEARPALERAQPLLTLGASTLGGARAYLPLLGDAVDRLHTIAPPLANLAKLIAPAIGKGIEGVFAGLGGLAADPGPGGRNSSAVSSCSAARRSASRRDPGASRRPSSRPPGCPRASSPEPSARCARPRRPPGRRRRRRGRARRGPRSLRPRAPPRAPD